MHTFSAYQTFYLLGLVFDFSKAQISDNFRLTVSIYENDAYKAQRKCVQGCLLCDRRSCDSSLETYDCIADYLGCDAAPAYNDCYCRRDLEDGVESFMSSCVDRACQNTEDSVTAYELVQLYCAEVSLSLTDPLTTFATSGGLTSAFGPATVAKLTTTMATTTSPGLVPSSSTFFNGEIDTTGAITTQASTAAVRSDLPATSSSMGDLDRDSGLSRSDQIALGVGLSVPVVALIIALLTLKIHPKT